ncbi:MAG: glycosyltransferase family 1 protein, partial [Pseudonocardiaceae bacterium]
GMTVARGDADGLAAALRSVLAEPGVARAMRAAGRRQAERFSWERTARRVWAVHLELRGAGLNHPGSRQR